MMISYSNALRIQRAQMSWYRSNIGMSGIRAIRSRTKPCPDDLHPETPVRVSMINDLVPRGGDFEQFVSRGTKCQNSADIRLAVHESILHGLT